MSRHGTLIAGIVLLALLACLSMIYRLTYRVPAELVGEWENVDGVASFGPGDVRMCIDELGRTDFEYDRAKLGWWGPSFEIRKWGKTLDVYVVETYEGRRLAFFETWRIELADDGFTETYPNGRSMTWRRVAAR